MKHRCEDRVPTTAVFTLDSGVFISLEYCPKLQARFRGMSGPFLRTHGMSHPAQVRASLSGLTHSSFRAGSWGPEAFLFGT